MGMTKEEIAAKTRAFLEKPTSPRVTEKDREDQCLALLDAICGPGDESLIAFLFEIAQGSSGHDVMKGDRLVTVYPSANERTNAARLLRVWHRGLATRAVKITKDVNVKVKWDPSKLPLSDLQALEAMHAKAALPEGTVDGVFTETADQTPEKAEIPENSESSESED